MRIGGLSGTSGEESDARENGLDSGNAAVASTFLVLEPKKLIAETRLKGAKSAKASFIVDSKFRLNCDPVTLRGMVTCGANGKNFVLCFLGSDALTLVPFRDHY